MLKLGGQMSEPFGSGVRSAEAGSTEPGSGARVMRWVAGGLLALQIILLAASLWLSTRMADIRCGPEDSGPRSHALLGISVLGVQVAAIGLAIAALGRARVRKAADAALLALAAAAIGAALGAAALVYGVLLAMGC
jgi:hypothetical protein